MRTFLFILASFLFSLGFSHSSAMATSWAQMNPETVNSRAELIVLGKYDFKGERVEGKEIFSGYEFKVEKVYRGTANDTILAGIDMFDVGWVDEFQQEGGKFLLLLEKGKERDFLVPVGGPNGMIAVKDGTVIGENKTFYENILHSAEKEPLDLGQEEPVDLVKEKIKQKEESPNKIYAVAAGMAFILLAGFTFSRKK